ncbi:Hypothetical protein R9X50_00012600 [Acrodontium crateriforme]|uniref:Uncharacterized protein n=1 Tax=Acrodontium crateriforme TaxID=150365 RepID=A0AAQ3LZS1_9PEZI|nr:Hypothetical protein R9X50_00012600 [Acrodontium crateriforme]
MPALPATPAFAPRHSHSPVAPSSGAAGLPPLSISLPPPGPDRSDGQGGHSTQLPPKSPVAPPYSPITPKAVPALPATVFDLENDVDNRIHPDVVAPAEDPQKQYPSQTHLQQEQHQQANLQSRGEKVQADVPPSVSTANFIPLPPSQPFSSEDSTDAIALRAAISALQFQKKKAQDDVRALEKVRKQALAAPEHFKSELAAGRMKEQRSRMGDVNAIIDHSDSEASLEDDSDDEKSTIANKASTSNGEQIDVPDSQTTESSQSPLNSSKPSSRPSTKPVFAPLPGPQNIVRMPPINWAKYNIIGAPLDSLHEQQQRWPGAHASFSNDRGREHAVSAPYSPFLDHLDPSLGPGPSTSATLHPYSAAEAAALLEAARKDSVANPYGISEHPMETRRSSSKFH